MGRRVFIAVRLTAELQRRTDRQSKDPARDKETTVRPMTNRLAAACLAAAPLALAGTATAQSFEGDTFTWQFDNGFGFPPTNTATVGPGTDFSIVFLNRVFDVDIDASSINITARFTGLPEFDTWGNDGSSLLGQLRINGLEFSNGVAIGSASVSGSASGLDAGDVAFTSDSVSIGASLPNANTIGWTGGQTLRVELTDGCPGPNVTNATSGATFETLSAAMADAAEGDTLDLAPCTFFEQGLSLKDKGLTLRGAGPGLTVIDGQHRPGTILRAQDAGPLTISGITFRNGLAIDNGSGGVLALGETSLRIESCEFINNDVNGGTVAGTVLHAGDGDATIVNTVFRDNTNSTPTNSAATDFFKLRGTATLVNCAFLGGSATNQPITVATGANVDIVNCTFAGSPGPNIINALQSPTQARITNCVSDGSAFAILAVDGAQATASRSVFPGAGGDNIDAAAVFINPSAGDYRLAPGSPGVDLGNYAAYVAAGGGISDLAGVFRAFDDPDATNFDLMQPAIDAGAFELQAGANPTPNPCPADLALPSGVLDLGDIDAFIQSFQAGCP